MLHKKGIYSIQSDSRSVEREGENVKNGQKLKGTELKVAVKRIMRG